SRPSDATAASTTAVKSAPLSMRARNATGCGTACPATLRACALARLRPIRTSTAIPSALVANVKMGMMTSARLLWHGLFGQYLLNQERRLAEALVANRNRVVECVPDANDLAALYQHPAPLFAFAQQT